MMEKPFFNNSRRSHLFELQVAALRPVRRKILLFSTAKKKRKQEVGADYLRLSLEELQDRRQQKYKGI